MKKLNLTALTAAVLMGGSLLASSGAMASAASGSNSATAGTACKAYSSSSESSLKPDWSTVKASSALWVHCPAAGVQDAILGKTTVYFNMEIPVDALTDVYNCYVAEQSAVGSTRKVEWESGSDAGPTTAKIVLPTTFSNINGVTGVMTTNYTYTGGCKLGVKHMLHSVVIFNPQ